MTGKARHERVEIMRDMLNGYLLLTLGRDHRSQFCLVYVFEHWESKREVARMPNLHDAETFAEGFMRGVRFNFKDDQGGN